MRAMQISRLFVQRIQNTNPISYKIRYTYDSCFEIFSDYCLLRFKFVSQGLVYTTKSKVKLAYASVFKPKSV